MGLVVHLLAIMLLLSAECFAGESALLTGRCEYRTDPESLEVLGDLVCFYPDATSAKFLDRSNIDKRSLWLCFTNASQSKRLLGIVDSKRNMNCGLTGEAKVRIANYKTYLGEGKGLTQPNFNT